MDPQTDLLQEETFIKRRRALLPWWMKVFVWIFFIFGLAAPVAIIFGLLDYEFELSIYGFETSAPISLIGFIILGIFLLKGLASYGLWFEKDWAINVALADAFIGFAACIFVMVYVVSNQNKFSFRLELLFLALYLWQLQKMKYDWKLARPVTVPRV